ncbi:MAG: hypothetical protein LBC18_08010, partial [Opitutaceae bacterium]|nr:hypothetical protein [Opitutaceae bacterium]
GGGGRWAAGDLTDVTRKRPFSSIVHRLSFFVLRSSLSFLFLFLFHLSSGGKQGMEGMGEKEKEKEER